MVLLLGYKRRLDPIALREAMKKALQAFPHLSARIDLNLQPLRAELVPSDRELQLEWIRSGEPLSQPLEDQNQATLFARFAPSAAASARTPMQALQSPLLQLRLTWLPESEGCVLGVMVSHMVMDGSGLALFLAHMIAAMRGGSAPDVVHDRRHTFPDILPAAAGLPPHYVEVPQLSLAMAEGADTLASSTPTVFSLSLAELRRSMADKSSTEARLYLAAHLCQEVAARQLGRRTLALWCNARGLGHVPRNYTGNAGCYTHVPLEPGNTQGCYQNLKRTITRTGFAEIKDAYGRLKSAEAAGRVVFWNGPGENLLSLNLVPPARGAADFGQGGPDYAQLLTRNVSGLRLYSSADGERLVVEACLPEAHGAGLIASCEGLGLVVHRWHQSESLRT